ncbi:MAG: hypothetical protein DWQ40_00410 [Actinobacteria bacterium]|nr:MAG: hypothetical protein DWQ40_00410 [Actinomycetota bacterium]
MRDAIVEAAYDVFSMKQHVIGKSLAGIPSNAARFTKYPKLTASALTDGTDLTANTAFTPTQNTLTVGEAGLKLTLTDLADSGGIVGMMEYGRNAGLAVAEKITGDLVALGAGFSTSEGTTNVDLTEQVLLDTTAVLRAANIRGPYARVLHPDSYYKELIGDIGTTFSALGNTGGMVRSESNDLPGSGDSGLVGNLFGHETFISSQVGEDGSSDKENFMYAKNQALGYVERWPIRVEIERDASLRGDEIVVTAAYAVGEVDDAAGVRIISDGA